MTVIKKKKMVKQLFICDRTSLSLDARSRLQVIANAFKGKGEIANTCGCQGGVRVPRATVICGLTNPEAEFMATRKWKRMSERRKSNTIIVSPLFQIPDMLPMMPVQYLSVLNNIEPYWNGINKLSEKISELKSVNSLGQLYKLDLGSLMEKDRLSFEAQKGRDVESLKREIFEHVKKQGAQLRAAYVNDALSISNQLLARSIKERLDVFVVPPVMHTHLPNLISALSAAKYEITFQMHVSAQPVPPKHGYFTTSYTEEQLDQQRRKFLLVFNNIVVEDKKIDKIIMNHTQTLDNHLCTALERTLVLKGRVRKAVKITLYKPCWDMAVSQMKDAVAQKNNNSRNVVVKPLSSFAERKLDTLLGSIGRHQNIVSVVYTDIAPR